MFTRFKVGLTQMGLITLIVTEVCLGVSLGVIHAGAPGLLNGTSHRFSTTAILCVQLIGEC